MILSAYDAPSILHRKRYQEAGVDFDDDGLLKVTKETWDVAAQDSRFSYLWFLAMDVLGEKPKLSMADLSTRPIAEMIEDVKQADMLFMNERKAKSAEARKNKRESKTEDSKKPEPSSEKPEPSASFGETGAQFGETGAQCVEFERGAQAEDQENIQFEWGGAEDQERSGAQEEESEAHGHAHPHGSLRQKKIHRVRLELTTSGS